MSTVEQIKHLLDKAKKDYQAAEAMHEMSKMSFYSGRVEAIEDVLKILTGSITGE